MKRIFLFFLALIAVIYAEPDRHPYVVSVIIYFCRFYRLTVILKIYFCTSCISSGQGN